MSSPPVSSACLTLHQPWASLVVHGIKRVEGRSWRMKGAPMKLWIHAASREPTPEEIRAVEAQYAAIYRAEGVDDLEFPEVYPLSALLGCVTVSGIVTEGQLHRLCDAAQLPPTLTMESESQYLALCEQPQRLILPWRCPGKMKVWTLPRREAEGAASQLEDVEAPNPMPFREAMDASGIDFSNDADAARGKRKKDGAAKAEEGASASSAIYVN